MSEWGVVMMVSERGFSLIETLQGTALFAIAAAAISSLLVTTIQANTHATHMTAAASFAQRKIEELHATPVAALAAGEDSSDESGVAYARTWTVNPGPSGGSREVAVTVQWIGHGNHVVTLKSIVAR